jgi:hypothetical protein
MKSIAFTLAVVFGLALPAHAQQMKLEIKDGRVTLEANGVPARQILAEWARVGGTKVIGADKIAGGPLTLRLADMPERQALDIILRSVAGFMAAERQASAEPGASTYDRIFILASSTPVAQSASARPANPPPNSMAGTQRRVPRPPNNVTQTAEEVAENDDADQEQAVANPNQPVFTFPAPQGGNAVPFGPGNPNANPATMFGNQPGTVQAPVISLQPGANGQPNIYNFVPNGGVAPPQTAPSPTVGFGVVGSPRPGMIQQPPTPQPPPPGQNPRPPGQ